MFIFKNSEEATKWLVDEGHVSKTTMPMNVYKDLAFAASSMKEMHNRLWFYATPEAYAESVKISEAAKKVNGKPIGAFVGPNATIGTALKKSVFPSVREAARFFNVAESTLRGCMQKAKPLNGVIFCNYALKTPAVRQGMPKLAAVQAIPAPQAASSQPQPATNARPKGPVIPNPLVLTPENLLTPVMLVRSHGRYLFKNLSTAAKWYTANYKPRNEKDIYLMIRRLAKDATFQNDVWKYHNSDFFREIVQAAEKAKVQRTVPVYVNTPTGKATCFSSEEEASKATGIDVKSIYTAMLYRTPTPGGYAFSRFEVHTGDDSVAATPATSNPNTSNGFGFQKTGSAVGPVITTAPDFSKIIPL
jgi:hypothetical protein